MTCSETISDRWVRALSVGPAASQALALDHCALRVHSLFPTTMNLAVGGTDWIVSLSGPAGGGQPHAVVLEDPADFRTWRVVPGSPARLLDGSIRLQGLAGEVGVDLGQARRLPARPLPSIVRLGDAHRACVLGLARIQDDLGCDLRIAALGPSRGATTALAAELGRAALGLATVARALAHSRPATSAGRARPRQPGWPGVDSLRRAVGALVGLGAGLTPSGDDFLCGFMAAASAFDPAAAEAGEGLAAWLNDAAEANLGGTGDISAGLIRCAMRSFWPGPLVDLAAALAQELEEDAWRALDALCLLGHSSGADLATGFLFGMEILVAPPSA